LKNKKTILISPLDWGIGHASRVIPIIELLINDGHTIIIAANYLQKKLLISKFPELLYVDIVSYNIELSDKNSQNKIIFAQIPKILRAIKKENKQLKKLIKKYNIDIVISDNRYGLYNKKIKSIFITHQTHILLPKNIKYFEKLLNKINTRLINKFDVCWIPDNESENNFSGILSHKNQEIKKFRYIGILSKFNNIENAEIDNDILVILSGPEPQRSIFEKIIEMRLGDTNYKVIIVRGNNIEKKSEYGNIDYVQFADTKTLNKLICKSNYIISRSGYSSVMDYIKLQKKAIIVATPGQTEQEYLAKYLSGKKLFVEGNQSHFNFTELILNVQDIILTETETNLKEILNDL
jgi:uncharacterized protein (TIGR00661 family)